MNLCFLMGQIVEETKFNFIYNKKQTSIAKNSIKLDNNSIIKIIGYDDIADFLYSKIKINDNVLIQGILTEDNYIQIKHIKLFTLKYLKNY